MLISRRLFGVALHGGNGSTASRVAPGSDGLVDNGRAPQPGTAGQATTGFGSSANPATSPPATGRASGRNTRETGGSCARRSGPRPGTARQPAALHDHVVTTRVW